MPRSLALLLCTCFIAWLWYRDQRRHPDLPATLWLPVLWLLVLGSRPLSFWFGVMQSGDGGGSELEGNAFDRACLIAQIFLAAYLLWRRGLSWGEVVRNNKTLFLFYAYLAVTVLWADYPFVAFKRWFKDLGALCIILLVLTEWNPIVAMQTMFFRCAFVLLPLSVVFIKYIPELGRDYSHSGMPMAIGVTSQKNSLGEIVLVFGLMLLWRSLQVYQEQERRWFARESWILWLMLGAGGWLLWMSNSMTATLCLVFGAVVLLAPKVTQISRKSVVVGCVALVLACLLIGNVASVSAALLQLIGRDSTLTNRTDIWKFTMEHPVNPLFGGGYLMYWDLTGFFELKGNLVKLRTAHNGYLDIFLDGGWVGVAFLTFMLLALGKRAIMGYLTGAPWGDLRFAFFLVMLVYNVSESMFARRTPLWFAFLLFSVEAGTALVRSETSDESEESWEPQTG